MFAIDTNILIDYFSDSDPEQNDSFERGIHAEDMYLPPVVLSEFLSYPPAGQNHILAVQRLNLLEIKEGYWKRSGLNRALLFSKGYRPRLPDTLIAQNCIDHDMPLLTRDDGFRQFADHCGLKLVK